MRVRDIEVQINVVVRGDRVVILVLEPIEYVDEPNRDKDAGQSDADCLEVLVQNVLGDIPL